MNVRVLGHNLETGAVLRSTNLHDPVGGSFLKIDWDHTITSTEHTNGVTLWRQVSINTTLHSSGFREFRDLTIVERLDHAEIHASAGYCWDVRNGGTLIPSGTCEQSPNSTMGRGWYDCFEYKIAEVTNPTTYPWNGVTANQPYTFQVGLRDGAGTNNLVNDWSVRLDPDFHSGINGFVLDSGMSAVSGRSITVPASKMTAGIRKLVMLSGADGQCTSGAGLVPQDGEVTGVFVLPIKVN